MQQDLITITNKPALLEVNFEELKASLEKDLEKYRIVVTAETVADAKKLATELRKTKKVIDDRRKSEVAKATEPVKAFDSSMKELVGMVETGVGEIQEQVNRFEDDRRSEARRLLEHARDELWFDLEVDREFRSAEYVDLVILSALTTKGHLTAKVRSELRARVQEDKALQDQTARRLLELENESYKAGLVSPLTRDHVAHFLFETEDKYRLELDRILGAEIKRQEEAERRERERLEAEQRRKEREEAERKAKAEAAELERQRQEEELQRQAETATIEQNGHQGDREQYQEPQANGHGTPATPDPDATEWVKIECVFRIPVPTTASNKAIEDKLRAMMAAAGFQTRPEITVVRLD